MSTEVNACPHAGGEGPIQDTTRLDELESVGQALLDKPGKQSTEETFDGLQTTLDRRYELMHEHDPIRARALVQRAKRSAGIAALSQVINPEFFQKVIPEL